MNIYLDIDSSYRNREDYPNPADFMVISKQDTISQNLKNPASNEIILYPRFGTEPLYFYSNLSGQTVEKQYLPYMYKTEDPHIVQLDELPICPTTPEDVDQIIVDNLYPRGSIPLGQANEFYTDDYLENFNTKETRKIVSFLYETGVDIVFQSAQVLWSTLVGDTFKVGVEPISSTLIPPSNIYNFYRGKYLKFITGRATKSKFLITDYRVESESLSVFTLGSFSGILPQQGDIFQIVSDRRWYATLESPFSTTLPAYPAYQPTLPIADVQFTSNTIYNSTTPLNYITLNQTNDIVAVSNSGNVNIESIDDSNYFWDNPTFLNTTLNNKIVSYDQNTIYYPNYTNSDWSVFSSTTDANILSTTFPNYIDQYTGHIRYTKNTEHEFVSTIYKTSTNYYIYIECLDTNNTFIRDCSNRSVIIHSLNLFEDSPYIVWSECNYIGSNCELKYYFSRASQTDGTGLFSVSTTKLIYSTTISSDKFVHYIQNLDSIVWSNQIIVTILHYDSIKNKFLYDLYISDTKGRLWFFSNTLVELTSILDINNYEGTQYYYIDNKFYFFIWDKYYGLSYTYTEYPEYLINAFFPDKRFSPLIIVDNSHTIVDARVSQNQNGFFISYIQLNSVYNIITLNAQSFEIEQAVPYRIRKHPSVLITNTIPFEGRDEVQMSLTNVSIYPSSVGEKSILYSENLQLWFYIWNNKIFYSTDLNTWNEYTVSLNTYSQNGIMEVSEINQLNSLYIENNYSSSLKNAYIFSVTKSTTTFCAVGYEYDLSFNVSYYVYVSTNFKQWTKYLLNFPELTISDFFVVDITWGNGLFCIVGLIHENITPIIFRSTNGITWTYTLLPTSIYQYLRPHTITFSPESNLFYTSGLSLNSESTITLTETRVFRTPSMISEYFSVSVPPGTYTISELTSLVSIYGTESDFFNTYTYSVNLTYSGNYFKFIGYQKFNIGIGFDIYTSIIVEIVDTDGNADTTLYNRLGYSSYNIFIDTPQPGEVWYYKTASELPVFDGGVMMYSSDVINWSFVPIRGGYTNFLWFRSICWSSLLNKACAVGDTYTVVANSTGGIVTDILELTEPFYNICWAPEIEIFCAVTDHTILTSEDGVNWTTRYTNQSLLFYDIVWSPELRIFLTNSLYTIITSLNGIDWTILDYTFLLSVYNSFIWDSTLLAFCGISDTTGVGSLIYNVTEPRKYICNYVYSDTDSKVIKTTAALDWNVNDMINNTTGDNLDKLIKTVFVDKINLFVGITSSKLWYSSESQLWYENEIGYISNTYVIINNIVDVLWINSLDKLYILSYDNPYLFYTGTNIINISVVDYYSLNVDSTYRFAKIAWSPTAGFVITTTKQNTQQIDFLKSPDGINWTVSLQTNTMHTNYFMEWNSYFKAFIGLSIIDGNPNIVFSTNAENWYFYEMDTIYDSLSSSSDILGFISTNEINVWFAKFLVQLQSKTIVLNTKLSNGQIWIYNKQNTYDENLYVYFNNVYNIIDSNYKESSIFKIDKLDGVYTTENTQTNSYIYFLDRAINTRIPYNLYFEVLGSTIDNFNGLNEPFKRDQDKCYQITLQELIVPNKKIKTYIGNQISFYPYIYVVLKNEKTNVYSAYSMITNNNKMNQATFKISVSQFTSDPSRLPFIRLMSPATINSVFNLHKPFRFTIYLPNGEVFDLTESDNIFPDQSNPLLQVSATFRFNEKNKL